MDSGCLIDFETLKEGDNLFHITKGILSVHTISKKELDQYPIECFINSKEYKNDSVSFTKDGKELKNDIYPSIYKKDPFKFAFDLVKGHRSEVYKSNQENNKLWTENQSMKKEIEILRQAKVV